MKAYELTRRQQETMNFWKQMNHVMSYFKEENFRGDKRLPDSFMSGFLEVGSLDCHVVFVGNGHMLTLFFTTRAATDVDIIESSANTK